jgi:hypothetical protein
MVEWSILFTAMEAMGFPIEFLAMIKILFVGAVACMKVNGSLSESFEICWGGKAGVSHRAVFIFTCGQGA